MADTHETIADIIAEMRKDKGVYPNLMWDNSQVEEHDLHYADRFDAAHRREVDALNEQIIDLRQQRNLWSKRAAELVEKCNEQYAKLKQVGNAAELRETLEYPKDANDKYIHIGDAVHMLNTNHEGDHEWDDVVLSFEYVGKGGGDDWLVYGEDGAAWACECEVLKQEGGKNGNE